MPDSTTSAKSADLYELTLRVERPSRYRPGGYHPLEIYDEVHDGRYRILHRLGHGAYSTVWLALDQSCDNSAPPDPLRPRYVALKIVSASRGQQEATLLYELQALHQSRIAGSPSPGRNQGESSHIVRLLDYFTITGPNGSHCCLVTEVLGPSVGDLHRYPGVEWPDLLPLPIARCVAMQCAEALTVLHSQGIVHADLHLGNLAFALTADINSWTIEQLYVALGGEPVKVPFDEVPDYYSPPPDNASHHQPAYLVATPTVSHLWALCTASQPRIRLIDFSESFRLPFHPYSQPLPGTPWEFAAPELLLELLTEVTLAIDIWALACVIYSLFGHSGPFLNMFGNLPRLLADIIVRTGGKDHIPERFCHAFSENLAMEISEEKLRRRYRSFSNWDCYPRGQLEGLEFGDHADIAPLGREDRGVLMAVIAVALVVDPAKRAPARKILEILREGWGVMEPDVLDMNQLDPCATRKIRCIRTRSPASIGAVPYRDSCS